MIALEKMMGIILVLVCLIFLFFLIPPIFENSEAFVAICNFASWTCADTALAGESTFIKYFNVEPGLGTNFGGSVKVQWLLVKPSSGDELDYVIEYNDSPGNIPENIIKANDPVIQKSGYKEMTIQFNSFEPQTIRIHVSSEKYPNLDYKEILWEFMPDYIESRDDFRSLNLDVISNKILHQGITEVKHPNYKIGEGLRLVGFNSGTAFSVCYGDFEDEEISAPEECGTETCLCLCENNKGRCDSEQRLCFAYENVDYLISDAWSDGGEVTYPGIGDVNYLVKHYYCGELINYDKGIFDFTVEKLIREGKTFIRIIDDRGVE